MTSFNPRLTAPLGGQSFADWVGVSSVYDVLLQAAADSGHRTALTFLSSGAADAEVRTVTYHALLDCVTRTANALRRLGIGPGKVVAYMLPSLPETQFVLWGAETAAAALPLNPLLRADEIANLCRAAGATALIALGPTEGSEIWDKALEVRTLVPEITVLLRVGGDATAEGAALSFAEELARSPSFLTFDDRPVHDDVAAYFHTGGSTGAPKLVTHTHRNQIAAAFGGAYASGLGGDDVLVNGLPMFHVASTIFCSLGVFVARGQVVLLSAEGFRNPSIVANFWHVVERTGTTIVGGVPTALSAVVRTDAASADLSSVRMTISGAASLPRSVAMDLERITGQPVREVYGMTEAGGVICVDPVAVVRALGSVGMPIPFCEVRARRLNASGDGGSDTVCEPGEPGVLVVRGPNITPGYKEAGRSCSLFTEDGWLDTGDIGHVDADGRVFITGRSKDLIIRSGHNIDPGLIEESLLAHPDVAEAAAVGMLDAYAGEVPVAYVVLRHGSLAPAEALLSFAKQSISEPPAMPRRIFIVDRLPVTAVGKVFKPELRLDCAHLHLMELLAREPVTYLVVLDDPACGLVAQVRVRIIGDAERQAARERIMQALRGYLLEVEWL